MRSPKAAQRLAESHWNLSAFRDYASCSLPPSSSLRAPWPSEPSFDYIYLLPWVASFLK